MAGLTIYGLEIKTLEQVESEMDDTLHSTISPTLNLTSTSALGQLKSVIASHTSELWDAALALWASWDVDSATGAALDRLGRLRGTTRLAASAGAVPMLLSLDAGTYAAGSLRVAKVGDGSTVFSNPDVISLGLDNTAYTTTFLAEETGPVSGTVGQISVIASPLDGFNSATNTSAVITGRPVESDADFRRRSALELALKGSTTSDAIRADLLNIQNPDGSSRYDFVTVIENDTDATDSGGRPPHSFEALVETSATDQVVAADILALKPAGITAFGGLTNFVSDSQGFTHTIKFSRPTDVPLFLVFEPYAITGKYAGDAALEQSVRDWWAQNQLVGMDVIHNQLVKLAMETPGVYDVNVYIGLSAYGPQANYTIAERQRATIGTIQIFTSLTGGVP